MTRDIETVKKEIGKLEEELLFMQNRKNHGYIIDIFKSGCEIYEICGDTALDEDDVEYILNTLEGGSFFVSLQNVFKLLGQVEKWKK